MRLHDENGMWLQWRLPAIRSWSSAKDVSARWNLPTGKFCSSYPNPSIKWRASACNFATHTKVEAQDRQKINPLKASKRNNKKEVKFFAGS